MRKLLQLGAALLSLVACTNAAAYEGIGRNATPNEVTAWDIDVRPDFQGLPKGAGSVTDGEEIWIAKCSSCHGDFGDANHVFAPLVGNTTEDDIRTGRVASLKAGGAVRTTMTKVSSVSTLYDFIRRAMPWNAPKSLSDDEVYAVVAYLLSLSSVVPDDFVLSDQNIAQVQERMPNRNGMTRDHGLWDIKGKPDTHNTACMNRCKPQAVVLSELPDYARNAHGNLADQNRTYGAIRGQQTAPTTATKAPSAAEAAAVAVQALLVKQGCTGCHAVDHRVVGPAFKEITAKYQSRADARTYLADKIQKGGAGTWGQVPMPPQPQLSKADADSLAAWIAGGATQP